MANEVNLRLVGVTFVELIHALAEDGPGVEDTPQVIAFRDALSAVKGDLAENTDASILEITSGIFIRLAARRRGPSSIV